VLIPPLGLLCGRLSVSQTGLHKVPTGGTGTKEVSDVEQSQGTGRFDGAYRNDGASRRRQRHAAPQVLKKVAEGCPRAQTLRAPVCRGLTFGEEAPQEDVDVEVTGVELPGNAPLPPRPATRDLFPRDLLVRMVLVVPGNSR
jgi:hypothetical protein